MLVRTLVMVTMAWCLWTTSSLVVDWRRMLVAIINITL